MTKRTRTGRTALGAGLGTVVLGTLLLSGCASTTQQHAESGEATVTPLSAGPDGARRDNAGPRAIMPLIDLTEPDAVVRTTIVPEIIDTRTFPQQIAVSGFYQGQPTPIKNLLPEHHKRAGLPVGPANNLPVGELSDADRITPASMFPGISATPWTPPDPALAVGPDHVVETVNMAIAFYRKDGTLEFSARLDSTGSPGFFEGVGGGNFTFDPKCFYDHNAQRFFVLALEVYSGEAYITFAVSDDSDPNGIWFKYRTPALVTVNSTTYWVDYPGLGFDNQGFYVTGNLFKDSGPGSGFGGVLFRIFDKTPLLAGQPVTFSDIRAGGAASMQVAQHFGTPAAPLFLEVESNSQLRLWAIRNPLTNPSTVSTVINVPPFGSGGVDAPNLSGGFVSTLVYRIMNVQWRNGQLVAAHTTNSGGRAVARWYEISTGNWPTSGTPFLIQSGNIDAGPGKHTFFPAIYTNANMDTAIVMAQADSGSRVSVQATARKFNDPPGQMGALEELTIGTNTANGRWGDYFDIAVDPINDRTFWMVGERQMSGGWQTWITSFNTSSCPADLSGSSDPNDPGFGIPDGNIDANDFFYYLNRFAAGDLSVADLTGSLNPNDPGFGIPDGNLDANDFFFYLDLFAQGCP